MGDEGEKRMEKRKSKKQKELLARELINQQLKDSLIDPWMTVKVKYPKSKELFFAVIYSDGIKIFEYNEINDCKLIELESHLWSEWKQVKVDYFAVSSDFHFTGETSSLRLSVQSKGKKMTRMLAFQTHLKVEREARPFWRKVVGFRSKSNWKMVTATLVYVLFFVGIAEAVSLTNNNTLGEMGSKFLPDKKTSSVSKSVPDTTPDLSASKSSKPMTEIEYLEDLSKGSQEFSTVLLHFSSLLLHPKLEDSGWKRDLNDSAEKIIQVADKQYLRKAPDSYKEINDLYLKGIAEYKTVAEDMPKAIDRRDGEKVQPLQENMKKGNNYITDAMKKLNNKDSSSIPSNSSSVPSSY